MKTCNKCQKPLPLKSFGKDVRNQDGLQGICEECRKKFKRASRAERMAGKNITPVTKKRCNKCGTTRQADNFYKDSGISDGLSTICKTCKTKSQAKWRTANRERYNAKMREYNRKNYLHLRLQRYKISADQHQEMLKAQKGLCAICGKDPIGARPLAVDHCHASGTVRGLLCYGCNRAIAILDKPELLKKATLYIRRKRK